MAKKPSFSNSTIASLKNLFRLQINDKGDQIQDKVILTTQKIKDDSKKALTSKYDRVSWDQETDDLYNWWWTTTHLDIEEYKNRKLLYEDMDVLFLNCFPVIKAGKICQGEIIQADSNNQPIFVDAKRPVKKFIEEFFDKINIMSLLQPTIKDFIKYGNAGWILDFDETGVSKVILTSPNNIIERLEFSPYEVRKKLDTKDKFLTQYRQLDRMEQYIQDIVSKETGASYFDSYLIGFQIDDRVLPPWKFLHFRNMTNDSPFKPFGVPPFIHAMGAFRQYDAAMGLQITARGMRFPKNHYKLSFPNTVSPADKLEAAIEFMNEFQNSGLGLSKKELPGIGDNVVSIKDTFEYEQIAHEIDLGKMDDIEMLRDDLYNACIVPRNLIDPNDSSYGDSGISLVEKFKPFARNVFEWQTCLLEQITQLVRIHMICSGSQFASEDVKFILSMPYPESQTNNDIITSQSSLLGLANDTISALSDKLLGGEALPPEIVKQIYTKFLPYDDEIIDRWVDDTIKAKEDIDEASEQEAEDNFSMVDDSLDVEDDVQETEQLGGEVDDVISEVDKLVTERFIRKTRKKWRMVEKTLGRIPLKEAVENEIFETKHNVIREGVICSRHVFSSKVSSLDFNAFNLRKYDTQRYMLLQEDADKTLDSQEIEYEFTSKATNKKTRKKRK